MPSPEPPPASVLPEQDVPPPRPRRPRVARRAHAAALLLAVAAVLLSLLPAGPAAEPDTSAVSSTVAEGAVVGWAGQHVPKEIAGNHVSGVTVDGDRVWDGKVYSAPPRASKVGVEGNRPRRRLRCYTGGNAFHLVFVYPNGPRPDMKAVTANIHRLVEETNFAVWRTSQHRRELKVLTVRGRNGKCVPRIRVEPVPMRALRADADLSKTLYNRGLRARSRKYLAFTNLNIGCGEAQGPGDTTGTVWNRANAGPTYGRIDRWCWTTHTVMHELTHMLGAVNAGAPYHTRYGHCRDNRDVMCYDDGHLPGGTRMMIRCWHPDWELMWDCGRDTYYAAYPRKGSYLDTHWNIARSSFLYGGGRPWPTYRKPAKPKIRTQRTPWGMWLYWTRTNTATSYRVTVSDGRTFTRSGRQDRIHIKVDPGQRVQVAVTAINPNGTSVGRTWVTRPGS